MSLGSRLDRLAPGLTAHERAVLVVRAHHAGTVVPPAIRPVPDSQVAEFNRHMALANAAVHVLLPRALMLQADVEALELRALLAATLGCWQTERMLLHSELLGAVRIPIAESEYEGLVAQERAIFVPLADAADLVVAERGDDDRHPVLRELRALVRVKAVQSRGRGRGVEVELGSLYDRLGLQLEVFPEAGGRFEVVADAAYEAARWRREAAERALSRLAWPLGTDAPGEGADDPAAALRTRVEREAGRSRVELRALEQVAGEVRDDFGDAVVIPDVLRDVLDGSRRAFEALGERGWVEAAEIDEAELAETVRVLRAAVDNQKRA